MDETDLLDSDKKYMSYIVYLIVKVFHCISLVLSNVCNHFSHSFLEFLYEENRTRSS